MAVQPEYVPTSELPPKVRKKLAVARAKKLVMT